MKRILTILLASWLCAGCPAGDEGSNDEASEEGAPEEGTQETEESAESEETAEEEVAEEPVNDAEAVRELGDRIFQRYNQALLELAEVLDGFPETEQVAPAVASLKERIITDMIALGREREALSEAGRTAFSMGLSAGMMNNPNQEAWDAYSEAFEHYNEADFDFGQELTSFNVITQYAQFDLLREQLPEEADRLGLP